MTDDEEAIRADERKRIAGILTRYFVDGPATFRALTYECLELDYGAGMDEGWLEFTNAVADHDKLVAAGERPA